MKLQNAWSVLLLSVVKAVYRCVISMLCGVGRRIMRGGSGALPEFVLSYGMMPSPVKDPASDAWLALKQRRKHGRDKPKTSSEPAKVLPIRGSVDDPMFRINM